LVINFSEGISKLIEGHIASIFAQLQQRPERFGIGEADPELEEKDWYPPNAFHTYWTLEILDSLRTKSAEDYERLSRKLDLIRRRDGMLLWARQQLAHQIALHSGTPPSSVLDTDQLGWSLSIFLRFDKGFHANLEKQDFIKQSFKCLFSTQTEVGTWRHYKPLFHYEEAGNAYCYVFETFAALLGCALIDRPESEIVRELLKPYFKNLMDLWRYATSTQVPLAPGGKVFGWCSSHRTNVTSPESWATASVFSYTQSLRRLTGIWCREEAQSNLNTIQSRRDAKEATKEIADRGKTWGSNRALVSEQLWTMFINPIRMQQSANTLEPDSQPIEENQARSAILFGPPGTSKTTLVRSLADVIHWKYVEIHASHFVKQGLAQVQKTADNIFEKLTELDHAVVLFDEIDELVRERDIEKDAFGRFLTTSMLPKLALLWDARKILYFVATNHINYFDSAIIRSHRFDALILVSPPSFETKIARLSSLLSKAHGLPKIHFQLQERDIQKELDRFRDTFASSVKDKMNQLLEAHWRELELDNNYALAKFALLRYDEIDELAYRLANILKERPTIPRNIPNDVLKDALAKIADSQWRKNKSYSDFFRDMRSERKDYQMVSIWRLTGRLPKSVRGFVNSNGGQWLSRAADSLKDIDIPGFDLLPKPQGRVQTVGERSYSSQHNYVTARAMALSANRKSNMGPYPHRYGSAGFHGGCLSACREDEIGIPTPLNTFVCRSARPCTPSRAWSLSASGTVLRRYRPGFRRDSHQGRARAHMGPGSHWYQRHRSMDNCGVPYHGSSRSRRASPGGHRTPARHRKRLRQTPQRHAPR